MSTFTELPVHAGVGQIHVNYFRTFIHPKPGTRMPSGESLILGMPGFMDAHSARVWIDGRRHEGRNALTFKGVARVRPFILGFTPLSPITPIPLPESLKDQGVPERLRAMMIPQIHTDSVGVKLVRPHAFTVQTLKREFETDDDRYIRSIVDAQFERESRGAWRAVLERAVAAANPITMVVEDVRSLFGKRLADYAVDINQHHFLAGRRSFVMGTVGDFALPADKVPKEYGNNDWIFETAAVECFSSNVYARTSDYAMGGDAFMLRPVWTEMCTKLANQYGTQRAVTVNSVQTEFKTVGDVMASPLYHDIAIRHHELIPSLTKMRRA